MVKTEKESPTWAYGIYTQESHAGESKLSLGKAKRGKKGGDVIL